VGVLHLNSHDWASSITSDAGAIVTHAAWHTIRGRGRIYAALDNLGLISSDVGGWPMIFSDGAKSNSGTIEATNGAQLLITGTSIAQSGAGLVLADGGSIQFDNAGLSGGLLHSQAGGIVQITGTSTLTNVASTADLRVQAGHQARIGGSHLTNNGLITVNPEDWGYVTSLHAPADAILTGMGEVVLNAADWAASITSGEGTTLTNDVDHTIRGRGRIYAALDNRGTIRSDVGGWQMIFSDSPKINAGTIESVNGAHLLVTGTSIVQSESGVVQANGGSIQFHDAGLTGGVLESVNGGTVHVTGASTLSDLHSNADVRVQASHQARIGGSHLTNDALITVNPEDWGYVTSLHAPADSTLDGSGTVLLNGIDWLATCSVAPGATLTVGAEQTVKGIGRLDGAFVFEGRLAPGKSVGTIGQSAGSTVFGPNGRLEIEVESAGSADRFNAWGAAVTLGGTLEVAVLNNYTPSLGDSFVIVSAPSIGGAFANVTQSGLSAPLAWRVQYTPTSTVLRVSCQGDANGDGVVNSLDVLEFLNLFVAGDPRADANGDTVINTLDFLKFLNWYNQACP